MCSNNNQLRSSIRVHINVMFCNCNCSITVHINVMFCNYPSISSLIKHLGMYVCINLYHCPHLAAVIVPMFLCRAWSVAIECGLPSWESKVTIVHPLMLLKVNTHANSVIESSFAFMMFMEVLMNVYLSYGFNCWRKWMYILRKWTAKG